VSLGTHRFQRASVAGDAMKANGHNSETARWKRCVPRRVLFVLIRLLPEASDPLLDFGDDFAHGLEIGRAEML